MTSTPEVSARKMRRCVRTLSSWKRSAAWCHWKCKRCNHSPALRMANKWWNTWPEGVRLVVGAGVVVGGLCGTAALIGIPGDGIYKAGLLIGGLAGLLLAAKRTKTAQETARISLDGQITDRYSKAVEQLGSENVTVRIGGLYALKRIAEDSLDHDFPTVLDVLTHFIRFPTPYHSAQKELSSGEEFRKADANKTIPNDILKIPDILTAIRISTALLKRVHDSRSAPYLDFCSGKFSYMDMSDADFSHTNISLSQFCFAILDQADFQHARAMKVNLRGAHATRARLNDVDFGTKSIFNDAQLKFTLFSESKLSHAQFINSNLKHVEFDDAILTNSSFENCKMEGGTFVGAKMNWSYFKKAELTGARFDGANLRNSTFIEAELFAPAFKDADLHGAIFARSHLIRPEYTRADLSESKFMDAIIDGGTFADADLTSADFTGANVESAVFDGAWFLADCPPRGLKKVYRDTLTERPLSDGE